MKRLTLIALLVTGFQATAQDAVEHPRFILGGTFNVSQQKNEVTNQITFSDLQGEKNKSLYSGSKLYAMMQFNPHWSAGIQFGHQMTRMNYRYEQLSGSLYFEGNYQDLRFGGGLTGRYTFNPTNRLQFGLNASAVMNRVLGEQKDMYGTDRVVSNNDGFGIQAKISPVILFDVNRRLRITAELLSLQFEQNKTEKRFSNQVDRQDGSSSNFIFTNNLSSVYVGIEFKL